METTIKASFLCSSLEEFRESAKDIETIVQQPVQVFGSFEGKKIYFTERQIAVGKDYDLASQAYVRNYHVRCFGVVDGGRPIEVGEIMYTQEQIRKLRDMASQ